MAALVLTLAASGCSPSTIEPTGSIATDTREIGDVRGVELRCAGVVTLVPDSEPGVTVRADRSAINYLETKDEDGVLTVSLVNGGQPLETAPGVVIEVEVRSSGFTVLKNTARGKIVSEALLDPGQLAIGNYGAGSVEIRRVETIQVTCDIGGAGDVRIGSGLAGAQEIRISGAGSYLAPDLESGVVTLTMTGSGDAEVWATEGLDATVNGTGYVRYWGEPELTDQAKQSGKTQSLGWKEPQ